MRRIFAQIAFVLVLIFFFCTVDAQNAPVDSTAIKQRAAMFARFEPVLLYPLIKGSPASGVLPVTDVTEPIDPKLKYRLLFDCTQGNAAQYKEGKVNDALQEIGRIINLHKAAGVKDNNLEVTLVVHSIASLTFLNDASYSKRYGRNNPNKELVDQLLQARVKIIVCGQTMMYREIENKDLIAGVKKSFSARTALSTYLSKGFVLFPIAEPH
jgi:intracellular sulfur oxidation DsrE/DsrF family protein